MKLTESDGRRMWENDPRHEGLCRAKGFFSHHGFTYFSRPAADIFQCWKVNRPSSERH